MSLLSEYKQYMEASKTRVATTFSDQQNSQIGKFALLQYELLSILLRRHNLSNMINLETYLDNLKWYISNSHQFAETDISESLTINCIHRYIQRFVYQLFYIKLLYILKAL